MVAAETALRRLRSLVQVLWALSLGAAIILPALPTSTRGAVGDQIDGWLRKIGVAQHWGMYAPDPQRGQAYLDLRARLADGSEVPLEESTAAAAGWGTSWVWRKRRHDLWLAHTALSRGGGGNINRTWYAKAVCVREARRRGVAPAAILVDRVVRGFTNPAKVARGAPDLGPVERKSVQKIDCGYPQIQAMIREDQANHGAGG